MLAFRPEVCASECLLDVVVVLVCVVSCHKLAQFFRENGRHVTFSDKHEKYPQTVYRYFRGQDSSNFFSTLSVVVELDVAVRLVLVEVAVEVSHTSDFIGDVPGEDLDEKIEQRTYSYGGAVVYLGIAVVCGGSVVQQVASTIDALIENKLQGLEIGQYFSIDSRIQKKRQPGSKEDDV